jgi:hypothetical protein
MDKQQKRIKNKFSQLIASASLSYKSIIERNNENYLIGKKEGYEEILNMFLTCTQGDIKYVPASTIQHSLTEKLKKLKASIPNEEDEEKNSSEVKINEKKRRGTLQNDIDLSGINFNISIDQGCLDNNFLNNTNSNYLVNAPNKKKKFK